MQPSHSNGAPPAAPDGCGAGIHAAMDAAFSRMTRSMPGFVERASQRQMAKEIADTLSAGGSRIIAVEGQTGTGKTLGYLLSAIPAAQAEGKTLVIATATVALQHQLLYRDLPALKEHSGLDFEYVAAKGRGRYACVTRMERLAGFDPNQEDLFGPDPDVVGTPDGEHVKVATRLYASLVSGAWSGCRDDLKDEVAPDIWGHLTSTQASCTGKACPQQRRCPFYRARWAMRDADVIVANHDLVLSDLRLGGGVVLPDPEDTIYVFDEGHHLADKAVEHGTARGTLAGVKDILKGLPRALRGIPPRFGRPDISQDARAAHEAAGLLGEALKGLEYARRFDGTHLYRAPEGRLPEGLKDAVRRLAEPVTAIWKQLDGLAWRVRQAAENDPGLADAVLPELGMAAERLEGYVDLFALLTAEVEEGRPPIARWVERRGEDFGLEAAPVTAAPWLRAHLWSRCHGAVITSATLTALNRWSRFRAKTGLRDGDGTRYLRLASPFDYAANSELHVPWMQHDGGSVAGHTREIIAMMPGLLAHCPSGTLCLFASWKQLREVYDALPDDLRERVMCQGDMGRDAMLARHRERIEAGRPSVLFGVAGMSEGVDLPGPLCEHVIIAKLPFAPPDSPVDATRAEWLAARGQNPFIAMSVPEASLKLIQTAGRLIRTETDRGRITLLDRRIVTKRYGAALLDALPPFPRRIDGPPPQAHRSLAGDGEDRNQAAPGGTTAVHAPNPAAA